MSSLIPYLTFRNGAASLRFLSEVLGFEPVSEQLDPLGGVMHAELRRGEALIMGGDGEVTAGASPGLYLVVADVDATFARATAAGAEVVYGPEDTEWGTRRARIRDLDGHEWSFGTYQPGASW